MPVDEVTFGRYRLLSLIGEGGMGKVYKAHDTVMDRDVAIKVLPPEIAAQPGYAERFRREAYAAGRLSEPHIIPVHEAGEIDGRLYLVMPVIEGIDLDSLLRRDGPMNPPRAVNVVEQLAAALDAAHAVGLVHRDVKPSNALVTGRDFVYLIDFGIAQDAAASRLTSTGKIVGTMAYMAPERFTAGIADARSDVYALACVLHECLTGRRPFPGDSMEQQMRAHTSMDPPRPSRQRAGVPIGLDHVVARGMAKNPDQRYPTCDELAVAARRALATEASGPRAAAAPTLPHDPLPVPSGHYPAYPTHAETQHDSASWPPIWAPPPAQRPRRTLMWASTAVVLIAFAAAIGVAGYLMRPHRSASPPPASRPATAIAQTRLPSLLLSQEQLGTALGVTDMTAKETVTSMLDASGFVSDQSCVGVYGPVQAAAYEGSGWKALRAQSVGSVNQTVAVIQAVVAFSAADDARAFFTAATQSWRGCGNRQFTVTMSGSSLVETVSPVSTANGILSATLTGSKGTETMTCQRALTVVDNVAVDVQTCGGPTAAAVTIAQQIAARVTTAPQ
ncbi:hypothetical protein A5672_12200 [Mycobacterium alsense]|uniref:non-specific serine/threonine protein kinase n=1 Tax=Mycobacterium alsense TaxID=324058 RepID=A0ABD6P3H5_9MYCO|nr:hypothetical protein A5672_12200 [Mycobacterium alsense]